MRASSGNDAPLVVHVLSGVQESSEMLTLARNWPQDRYRLAFILLNGRPDAGLQQELRAIGIPCSTIIYRGWRDIPCAVLGLVRGFRAMRPAIVHAHISTGVLLGLLAAVLARVPGRVQTRHHSTHNHLYHPLKGVAYDKIANHLSHRIISPSSGTRDVLVDLEGAATSKVHVVPHGFVFPDAPPPAQPQRMQGGTGPHIAMASRPVAWKGIRHAILAFRKVLEIHPTARLDLYGWVATPHASELMSLLVTLPAGSWRTIGFEPGFLRLLEGYDLFVHVPEDERAEAFGLVYIEALATGIPCVFTVSGVLKDIDPSGLHGLDIVAAKDPAATAAAMVERLGTADRQDRAANAHHNRKYLSERLGIDRRVQGTLAVYDLLRQ